MALICYADAETLTERHFGLGACVEHEGRRSALIEVLPWMRDTRSAALAIAFDHVLGEEVFAARPEGSWSLTTELTIDFVRPVPDDVSRLHVTADSLDLDRLGGYSRGAVRTLDGETIAYSSTWANFIALRPEDTARMAGPTATLATQGDTTAGRIGTRALSEAGTIELSDIAPLANLFGTLHGGVWLVLTELAINSLDVTEFELTSIRVHYLRPIAPPVKPIIRARFVHRGRSFGVIEVVGFDPTTGKECVRAIAQLRARDTAPPTP